MKQTRRRSLSPGANKFLLVLNIVLFLGAIVLAVLNIDLKEYIPAAHSILFTLVIWHLLIIYVNIMDWMKYGFSSLLTIH